MYSMQEVVIDDKRAIEDSAVDNMLDNMLHDYICRHNQHLVAPFKMQTGKIMKMH